MINTFRVDKRKRWLWIGLIGLSLLLLSACSFEAEPAAFGSDQEWIEAVLQKYPELNAESARLEQVGRVIDGDTFDTAESEHRVRLIGVNTPEIRPVEHYGKEASAFTKSQLEGKRVLFFTDAGNKDRYGRLLRYVFTDGQDVMFNELLLQEGYANTMTIAPNVALADRFVEVERTAREQKRGLWAAAGKDGAEVKDSAKDNAEGGSSSKGKSNSDEQASSTTDGETNSSTSGSNACEQPSIKGNINSKGDKIYHKPGGASYEQTVAEELFCTEEEAVEAGFRASKR